MKMVAGEEAGEALNYYYCLFRSLQPWAKWRKTVDLYEMLYQD
jgi:hypothetical protein